MSFAVYLLAACLITLALEYVADNAIQSGNPRDPGLAPSVFEMSAIYQRVVASGPRKPARNSLVPSPEFGEYLGVIEGIVNIDPDTKRLPLGWTVLYDHGEKEWHRSIALAAADPKLLIKYPFLQKLIAGREHPYISFLNHDQLKQYAT